MDAKMERIGAGLLAMIAATATTLAAALAAAASGRTVLGFLLFMAAATPLPALASGSLSRWIRVRDRSAPGDARSQRASCRERDSRLRA